MSQRRLLWEILCPNRKKNEELSPEVKAAMVALLHTGMSAKAVGREFLTDSTTVTKIAKKFTTSHTFKNKERKGRPKKLNRSERRNLLRLIRKNRFISWEELCDATDRSVQSERSNKRFPSIIRENGSQWIDRN
jgi:transposase